MELKNQQRLAELRNILRKYLIRGQQLKSSLQSRGRFFKLLSSILNSDGSEDTVKDLAAAASLSRLISEQDVYIQHVVNLSKANKVPRSLLD